MEKRRANTANKKMRLILTRHGMTFENEAGVLQGHLNSQLNPEGIAQAEKLAKRFSKMKFDAIYSSDLDRAANTAKIIAKYHPGIKVKTLKNFREAHLGSLQGKKKKEVDWNNIPDDVEKGDSILKRAKWTLSKIFKKHKGQKVLLVGHGGINRALIQAIQNRDQIPMNEAPSQKNTAVNIFDINENNKHEVHLLNCTKHLDNETKYLKKKTKNSITKKGEDL